MLHYIRTDLLLYWYWYWMVCCFDGDYNQTWASCNIRLLC